jgi:hypothetical protein
MRWHGEPNLVVDRYCINKYTGFPFLDPIELQICMQKGFRLSLKADDRRQMFSHIADDRLFLFSLLLVYCCVDQNRRLSNMGLVSLMKMHMRIFVLHDCKEMLSVV